MIVTVPQRTGKTTNLLMSIPEYTLLVVMPGSASSINAALEHLRPEVTIHVVEVDNLGPLPVGCFDHVALDHAIVQNPHWIAFEDRKLLEQVIGDAKASWTCEANGNVTVRWRWIPDAD